MKYKFVIIILFLFLFSVIGCTDGNRKKQSDNKSIYEEPVIEIEGPISGETNGVPLQNYFFHEKKSISKDLDLNISGSIQYFPKDSRFYDKITVELSDNSNGRSKIISPQTALNRTGFTCDVEFRDLEPSSPDGTLTFAIHAAYDKAVGQEFDFDMIQILVIDSENEKLYFSDIEIFDNK